MNQPPETLLFSVIIPVYNRPDEVNELLQSLVKQRYKKFEVLVIEDGSTERCEQVVNSYKEELDISYFYKENSGQGFSRNYGFEKANGDYFVSFDSDCLIPPHYFETVNEQLLEKQLDAYGGPDRAHESFTPVQRAINYSMTSFMTTGGIRGQDKHVGAFQPRGFNMGISREVFKNTGGFKVAQMGEDIEFSIRIVDQGYKTGLISEAWVYHKRRTSLYGFFGQARFFGRNRINVSRYYPNEVKWIHAMPSLFVLLFCVWISTAFWQLPAFISVGILGICSFGLLTAHSAIQSKNIIVGLLSGVTSFIQLFAYGVGFMQELAVKMIE